VLRSALLALVLAAAVTTSLAEGAPRRLPGVALGSPVLLHAERATPLARLALAVATVLVRASRGEVPTQLSASGVTYEATMAQEVTSVTDRLEASIDELDAGVRALETG
jgi:hypothetical protein